MGRSTIAGGGGGGGEEEKAEHDPCVFRIKEEVGTTFLEETCGLRLPDRQMDGGYKFLGSVTYLPNYTSI
jgi:hypothetical protein